MFKCVNNHILIAIRVNKNCELVVRDPFNIFNVDVLKDYFKSAICIINGD